MSKEPSRLVVDATGNRLTYNVIGAAMSVHNALGPGYKEEVYERALAIELAARDIPAQRQFRVEVAHEGFPVALFMLDLFVAEMLVVEIKAFAHLLTNDEVAQVINYLKATHSPVGLLFNFGRRSLQYRRIFPPQTVSNPGRLGRDNVKRSS